MNAPRGPMTADPLASIALLVNPRLSRVMLGMAERLVREHGSWVHLFCTSPQDAGYYRRLDKAGAFASISPTPLAELEAQKPVADPARVLAEARAWEAKLGVPLNRLAVGNRHLGPGFALAGPLQPRSPAARAGYDAMLAGYVAALDGWERALAEKGIGLVLNGPPEAARLAAVRGIPYRTLAGARVANRYYWATDERLACPGLASAYATGEDAPAEAIGAPYAAHQAIRTGYFERAAWRGLAVDAATMVARHAYGRLRGHQRVRTGYALGDDLAVLWRRRREIRRLTGPGVVRLADLADKPFVLFALQVEPEVSIGVLSPEFFFQHAAIAAIARDLPAGVTLAVKEALHGPGRRPFGFYDQIAALKNVVLLDMREPGIEAARQAAAVATVTGTIGLEAAVAGTPVIAFGRHNLYALLPHVAVPDSLADLRAILHPMLAGAFDRAQAQADGARFLWALHAVSFDLDQYDFVDRERHADVAAERCYRSLLASLAPAAQATGA